MPDGATRKRGDLRVRLRVIRPRRLSDRERELLATLDTLCADEGALAAWSRRWRDAENAKRARERNAA